MSKSTSEKAKEKDIEQIVQENIGLMQYAHHAGSAIICPEDEGKIKGRAFKAMEQQTDTQMLQIMEQVQVLLKQAKKIKERTAISKRIYQAHIPFQPHIQKFYYLYRKSKLEVKTEKTLLSLIAPQEWDLSKRDLTFLAKVQLLADHTWKVLETASEDYEVTEATA